MNAQVSESQPPADIPQFIKIGEDGALLRADAPEWVAVLDTRTNLMWDVKARPIPNQAAADDLCKTLSVAGFKDWRAPTVEQLFSLADRSRVSPAINTDFFPDTPSDWFWTRTLYASSPSDCAWYVYFSLGNSYWYYQYLEGFVRAVRPRSVIRPFGLIRRVYQHAGI